MKNNLKNKAKNLRSKGYSFREIGEKLKISKSTASVWTRDVELGIKAKNRIENLGIIGRKKAIITIRNKQKEELFKISKNCTVLRSGKYNKDDYKLFLSLLYWGEGGKSRNSFKFINSDSEMIKVFLFLLRKSFLIDEDRFSVCVHLHEYHNRKEMIKFWSKISGIGENKFYVYNKPHTGVNKKLGYKGCLSVYYGDAKIFKEIFVIIQRFVKYCGIS
jgi:transcriptional regulator with XRE-family HTH domain